MNDKPKTLTEALLEFFKRLALNWMLRPTGGTPMKGSAHPKDKNRNPGVARNLRKTARVFEAPDPIKVGSKFIQPPTRVKPANKYAPSGKVMA